MQKKLRANTGAGRATSYECAGFLKRVQKGPIMRQYLITIFFIKAWLSDINLILLTTEGEEVL